MADTYMNMENTQEMFLYAENLCSWCLNADRQLLYSNSSSQSFFYNIFSVGSGYDTVIQHFSEKSTPLIFSDKTGIAWIATVLKTTDQIRKIYLLGPFFTVDATENYIWQLCRRMKISQALLNDLFKQLKLLPTIPLTTALRYSIMLHYCVTGEQCLPADILVHMETTTPDDNDNWSSTTWHGTWAAEQRFFKAFRDGTITDLTAALSDFSGVGQVGKLSVNDPLRQAKNEVLVMITLLARNAMMADVSPEGAYNLADYYFQRVESCSTITDAQNYSMEACQVFIQRVLQVKKNSGYSVPIAACMEYIETHITEKISLDAMAGEVGYTSYYLSNKFQKETGDTITHYIQKRKIECSKDMLKDSRLSVADISERLAFSSPSYFSSVFKKLTGRSPGEYVQSSVEKEKL